IPDRGIMARLAQGKRMLVEHPAGKDIAPGGEIPRGHDQDLQRTVSHWTVKMGNTCPACACNASAGSPSGEIRGARRARDTRPGQATPAGIPFPRTIFCTTRQHEQDPRDTRPATGGTHIGKRPPHAPTLACHGGPDDPASAPEAGYHPT